VQLPLPEWPETAMQKKHARALQSLLDIFDIQAAGQTF
jgi:hypothetical protein